jgi:ATP-dependent Clp protease ATP-binding subunit ClpX
MTVESKLNYCSFCETHKDKVKKLIVGDNVAICSDCIELCTKLIEDETSVVEPEEKQEEVKNDPSSIKEYLVLTGPQNPVTTTVPWLLCWVTTVT